MKLRKLTAAILAFCLVLSSLPSASAQAFSEAAAGVRASAVPQIQPSRIEAWNSYFQNRRLAHSNVIGINLNFGPQAQAISRVLARTDLQPGDFAQIKSIAEWTDLVHKATRPLAEGVLDELSRLPSVGDASAETLARLAELGPVFKDMHSVIGALPPDYQKAVIIAHHLVQTRLTQSSAAKIGEVAEKIAKEYQSSRPEDAMDAASKAETQRLSAILNAAENLTKDLRLAKPSAERRESNGGYSALADVLFSHQRTIASLEAADAGRANAHLLQVFQHGDRMLGDWLRFMRGIEDSPSAANPKVLQYIERIGGYYVADAKYGKFMGDHRDRETLQKILADPHQVYLSFFVLNHVLTESIADDLGWSRVERLLYEGLKALGTKDHLRSAINLVLMKTYYQAIPDSLWKKMLENPPQGKEERHAFESAVRIIKSLAWMKLAAPEGAGHPANRSLIDRFFDRIRLLAVKLFMTAKQEKERETLQQALERHGSREVSERLDYAGLNRDLRKILLEDLSRKLELTTDEENQILKNPRLLGALEQDGLLANILSLSGFVSETGLKSLKTLLRELSESPIENGRIRYTKRYEKLKGQVPDDILDRWMQDYTENPQGAAALALPADVDWTLHYRKLASGLGITSPQSVSGWAPKVQALAQRLRRELPASAEKDALAASLQDQFLLSLQKVLESLEANRAPPKDELRMLMPFIGKSIWMKDVMPAPKETLLDFRNLTALLSPPKAAPQPASEKELLHVTDDPAAMIQVGNEPIPTCQRCTEDTTANTDGEPVSRLLLGQIKLGYWMKGKTLVARTVLELGKDHIGAPALLVERVYLRPEEDFKFDTRLLVPSILKYARSLGVYTVYFADTSMTGRGWDVRHKLPAGSQDLKAENAVSTNYELLDDLGLPVYRDTFGRAWYHEIPAVLLRPHDASQFKTGLWERLTGGLGKILNWLSRYI